MEWILILWINDGNRAAIDHIDFPTKQVCEYVGEDFIKKDGGWGSQYYCATKSFDPPESKVE